MLLEIDDDFVDRILIKELQDCYNHLDEDEDDHLRNAIEEILAHYMVHSEYLNFINA